MTTSGFNPRSPRGGATLLIAPLSNGLLFQSTLPARGSDEEYPGMFANLDCFNPRSPRGGATAQFGKFPYIGGFQSTLPARGSDPVRHFDGWR